ncbi:MAG TPA: hypothetical protein DCW83_13855 [Saprospirales bacterium]|nr:hypothetical protein [Saprospirales bacterium]
MKSFRDTLNLYQEHIYGVFEATHTYHYPSHMVNPTVVTNRIIYISNAVDQFDTLKSSELLCLPQDEADLYSNDRADDVKYITERENHRKKVLEKDRRNFLSKFPPVLQEIIKDDNTLLYIDHGIEGWDNILFDRVCEIFDIPKERIRWLTSCYKFNNNETHPMGDNVIFINYFEKIMADQCADESMNFKANFEFQMEHYKNKKKRPMLCTSYMRRRRFPRTFMALMLNHNNLLKHMYWSLGTLVDGQTDFKAVEYQIGRLEKWSNSKWNSPLEVADFDWLRSIDKNITCDSNTLVDNLAYGNSSITWKHMWNTKFALVHETMPNGLEPIFKGFDHIPFLSEKAYKPFATGQLFVMHGCVGTVRALRDQGYDVFDDIISHDYDLVEDGIERAKKICTEVKRLSMIPDNEWEDILKSLIPRFEYNFNHLSQVRHNVLRVHVNDPKDRTIQ